ncbi:MAG: phosphodiester glycosidase family protein, partial [Gemmatimonadaceae bacterium]|nr:phosphodiester glycosidase family protein [Gemmatimonadaceae bacterium]
MTAALPFRQPMFTAASALTLLLLAAACSARTSLPPAGADAGADAGVSVSEGATPLAPLQRPTLAADTVREAVIAPGVVHRFYYRVSGPFAMHALEVDRAACWTPAALKPDTVAIGRALTSAMLARAVSGDTVAAVNADFFLFAPAGVPTGAHVDDGRVISGPMARPAFVIDSTGRARFLRLYATGTARAGAATASVTEWNHTPLTQLGAFDHRWGAVADTGIGIAQVVIGADGTVRTVLPGTVRASIPPGGHVLVAGRMAPPAVQEWVRSRRAGERVTVSTSLLPFHPHDAVGGFPMLAVDSAIAPALDSAHTQSLGRVRHPRTAVGIGDGGRRLVLVVVDGRQEGYSEGMTLPELARLMLELGARDALNL